MKFIEFYHNSTGYVPGTCPPQFDRDHVRPIPVCGSGSVYVLDGRFSMHRCVDIARDLTKKRGFVGFTINKGETFTRSRVIRQFEGIQI